jgi:putative Mg2+ transporter-C (MgtC) family protein
VDFQEEVSFVGKCALAAALAFIIGWERESRGSPAGDRTFAMVSLGAAAFTAIGIAAFPATAEKLLAGVVTGVGFLGAGMIVKEASNVRGLTTAAGIWAVSSIGVVVGAGEYFVGIGLTALIMLILTWERIPYVSEIGVVKRHRKFVEENQGNR